MSENTKINTEDFRVRPHHKVKLKQWPTKIKPLYSSKEDYEQQLRQHVKNLDARQGLLYAHSRYALLVIFQALDAGGKDSAIKHVMSGVNPQGCQVFSFKTPSAEELQHDFLWRSARVLPERGHIGIFNRSYYEEVLIVRIHPDVLAAQNLPEKIMHDKNIWQHRFDSIADFEKHLERNGTRVIKFFLHISKEEQRRRFLRRIEKPEKNWKFSMSDIQERKFWDQYVTAYEEALSATSAAHSPWFVVPGDDKKNARLIVSQVILDALKDLKLGSLKPTPERRREFEKIRKELVKE
jgi:PPK2 family polyphosphate:nucleotide phosphotransferase